MDLIFYLVCGYCGYFQYLIVWQKVINSEVRNYEVAKVCNYRLWKVGEDRNYPVLPIDEIVARLKKICRIYPVLPTDEIVARLKKIETTRSYL